MLALTARQKAILNGPNPRVDTLAEFRLTSGTERYWSGSGKLDFDGEEWLGCGLISEIDGIEQTAEPGVSNVTITVSGIPASALANLQGDLKGQTAVIYDAFMDGGQVDSAIVSSEIDLDRATWTADDQGTFTISVFGQDGYWQLEKALDEVWSPEGQDKRFPDGDRDTGLDGLPVVADLEVPWTRT